VPAAPAHPRPLRFAPRFLHFAPPGMAPTGPAQ